MKAILVIDMPKNCITCPYRFSKWNEEVGTFHICSICDERLREEDFGENRADFCPLKHMPHKREAIGILNDYERGKILGFNSCLKIILGEEE